MGGWEVQSGSGVRFEWGPAGASRLASATACLVAVDVLSFTTAVSVAVDRGIRVLPFRWPGGPVSEAERSGAAQAATAYARQSGARLASHRHTVTPETPWSLSPAHLRAAPFVARLVLPSPNGAAIATAAPPGVRVVAACLRNITAVGTWLTSHDYGTPEHPVAVIAAGELWPDGSLRPALEDLLGAGALVSALCSQGAGPLSPEAAAAKANYEGTADLAHTVATSASGRQLAAMGFVEDVAIATEEDASALVPVRDGDGSFVSG
ncbi:2-phosphosulfolactate phosphatase [Streptomyces sp. SAI-127]|uniref:2-phosphosulfolactate phosphatase n=1 Tax=Streptomyces sp. SAI-127 TaxID=2940543 RepID=UPI0024767EF9|nr:2-phosphosulfolactate phosphatase [Streptomyces sp. SAI-127]MDH6484590.1 2-phosphosulfolactate phosphatase [Streptomyces sp. SAI-127]